MKTIEEQQKEWEQKTKEERRGRLLENVANLMQDPDFNSVLAELVKKSQDNEARKSELLIEKGKLLHQIDFCDTTSHEKQLLYEMKNIDQELTRLGYVV
jgi:hypothetical protein